MDEILELRGKLLLDDHTGLLQICLLKKKKGILKVWNFEEVWILDSNSDILAELQL